MFEASRAMFIYCTSPVHAGAGQAFGLIDNPIQRERHTEHPVIAGAGVKGALRHHLWHKWNNGDGEQTRDLLNRIFGPEAGKSSDYVGAISFSDAQLVAFPIRSVKNGFVYATSPLCLQRAKRLLHMCGEAVAWELPEVEDGHASLINPSLLSDNQYLLLESQQITKTDDNNEGLKAVAESLAALALPGGDAYSYFRKKLQTDLVLLSDTDFSWFVKQSTVVEAHVKIKYDTGTAEAGSLHYTENLPPESILISAAMASVERKKDDAMKAHVALGHVANTLDGSLVQLGGDATTGRGQVVLAFTGGNHG